MKTTNRTFNQTLDKMKNKNKTFNPYSTTESFHSYNMNDFNYMDVDYLKEQLIKIKSKENKNNKYYHKRNINKTDKEKKKNDSEIKDEKQNQLKIESNKNYIKNLRMEIFDLNLKLNDKDTMINSLKLNSKTPNFNFLNDKFSRTNQFSELNDRFYNYNLIQKKYNDLKVQTENLLNQLENYKNKCRINNITDIGNKNVNKNFLKYKNFESYNNIENNKIENDIKKEYEILKNENEILKMQINNLKEKLIENNINNNDLTEGENIIIVNKEIKEIEENINNNEIIEKIIEKENTNIIFTNNLKDPINSENEYQNINENLNVNNDNNLNEEKKEEIEIQMRNEEIKLNNDINNLIPGIENEKNEIIKQILIEESKNQTPENEN